MTDMPTFVVLLLLASVGSWLLFSPAGAIRFFLEKAHPEISRDDESVQRVVRLVGGGFWFMVLMILIFIRYR
jgi:hypothetical protein